MKKRIYTVKEYADSEEDVWYFGGDFKLVIFCLKQCKTAAEKADYLKAWLKWWDKPGNPARLDYDEEKAQETREWLEAKKRNPRGYEQRWAHDRRWHVRDLVEEWLKEYQKKKAKHVAVDLSKMKAAVEEVLRRNSKLNLEEPLKLSALCFLFKFHTEGHIRRCCQFGTLKAEDKARGNDAWFVSPLNYIKYLLPDDWQEVIASLAGKILKKSLRK